MQRRIFIVGGLASLGTPFAAAAQQPKVSRVGVLSPWDASVGLESTRQPFERGLREAGWRPGATVIIEQRYANGKPEQLSRLANDLTQMRVDVIVAHGTSAIRATKQATDTIPIVMSAAVDPIREGLVENLARPGGNVTGLTLFPQGRMESKQLELFKDAIPNLTRVGILGNRSADQAVTNEISASARTLGLKPEIFEVTQPQELAEILAALARSGVGGMLVRPDPFILDPHIAEILAFALRHRMPAIHNWTHVTAPGGLIAYSVDIRDVHHRSAYYVDRILRGARPGDLPIEQPTKFKLVINLKTAKALDLTIPQSLLLRADQVIQ